MSFNPNATINTTDKLDALNLVLSHQPEHQLRFGRWLLKHWDKFAKFCDLSDGLWEARNTDNECFSARVTTQHIGLSNNWSADLARLYLRLRPERESMFATRTRTGR